ncbi:MAG: YraN family protein [Alphaproteobacteria bacterium]|nr:YraN family protein [Alphaproteobacteria bacterium]
MRLKQTSYRKKRAATGLSNWRRGKWSEALAGFWLSLKRYRIIARRKSTPFGEVDLVAISGKTLVLVEVKFRVTHALALEAVTEQQQQRLIRAADWLQRHYRHYNCENCRIDLVALSWRQWPTHIVDAFRRDPWQR